MTNELHPNLHGIPLVKVTDRAEREALGDLVGKIEIHGIEYAVRPDGRGGAVLFGRAPRTDPWSSGGRNWAHSQRELDCDGFLRDGGIRYGEIRAGVYRDRHDLMELDLGAVAGAE